MEWIYIYIIYINTVYAVYVYIYTVYMNLFFWRVFTAKLSALLLSVMIMPLDDAIEGGGVHCNGIGNVTQPFVTETYRCVAPYETKDTKNKPFKVVMDEKVDVLIKDNAGEQSTLLCSVLVRGENRTRLTCDCIWFRVVACGERGQAFGLVPCSLPGEAGWWWGRRGWLWWGWWKRYKPRYPN